MATQSFYEDMILDTPEKIRNFERAVEAAEIRGPIDFSECVGVSNDPEVARRAIERALQGTSQ